MKVDLNDINFDKKDLEKNLTNYFKSGKWDLPYKLKFIESNKSRLQTPYYDFKLVIEELNSLNISKLYIIEGWGNPGGANVSSINQCKEVLKTVTEYVDDPD